MSCSQPHNTTAICLHSLQISEDSDRSQDPVERLMVYRTLMSIQQTNPPRISFTTVYSGAVNHGTCSHQTLTNFSKILCESRTPFVRVVGIPLWPASKAMQEWKFEFH